MKWKQMLGSSVGDYLLSLFFFFGVLLDAILGWKWFGNGPAPVELALEILSLSFATIAVFIGWHREKGAFVVLALGISLLMVAGPLLAANVAIWLWLKDATNWH